MARFMIQPAFHHPPPFVSPFLFWLVVAVAVAAVATSVYVYRRGRAQEITIRRQLARETALKARFDDLFDRSSEIMIVHDRRGRVSTINRSGEQLTGYLREELRMLDPDWIFGTGYLDAVMAMINEGADSSPRSFRSEFVPRKGNPVPVDVQARVLVGDGEVVGVTSIARDLSERAKLENELRQAQKMEAVGRLATGIAHDFNNIITVLLGYSDELIEQAPPGTPVHAAAMEVRRAANRASALTQQLLAFSRRQVSVSHAVDLNQVIAHMEDLIRRLLGPEIRLQFSLQPDLAPISADPQQIGQVLMNLIVNARDAMPEGGTLRIETANVELGAEHVDIIPGPHVALTVTDSGVGMSADVRDRLFEPFFTTKDQGRGTGLGLSMVQAIVRQSGGHIHVDSQPGAGTTFQVWFPQQPDAAAAPVAEPIAHAPVPVKGEGVVLLAEDDQSVRRLVVTELTRRGFTVLEAEDGAAALEMFRREKDRIDVLVTDVVMPKMNGADLAKAAGTIRPGLKILFISGHPERAGAGLDPTGVTNLLMKPFTADTLAARIKEAITGRKEADGWSV
jgi:two-component system, cell cycle sensor histidine kinase and response regulator CckA